MIERINFWGVSLAAENAFWVIAYSVVVFFVLVFVRRMGKYGQGKPEKMTSNIISRVKRFGRIALAQVGIRNQKAIGWAHLMISWGFIVLLIGTLLVAIEEDLGYKILQGSIYLGFEFILDTAGLMIFIGLLISFGQRWKQRRAGKMTEPKGVKTTLLVVLLVVIITGFWVEALRIAGQGSSLRWSYVGLALSRLSGEMPDTLYPLVWWIHVGAALVFVVWLPFTRLFHVVTAPLYAWLAPVRTAGVLQPSLDLVRTDEREVIKSDVPLGPTEMRALSRAQLLSFDACVQCRRCEEVCPAYGTGKPLSPTGVILDLSLRLTAGPRAAPLGGKSNPEVLNACTTCGACSTVCPLGISPADVVVELRRGLVEDQGEVADKTLERALQNTWELGNPWGRPWRDRLGWSPWELPLEEEGSCHEWLYWVGCAAAFDLRNQRIARAMIRIMRALEIDFAVLGPEEYCCGDFARRAGDEGLFQLLVRRNINLFARKGVRRIVTHCPHCYHILKNEYRQFGLSLEVLHHTELLTYYWNNQQMEGHVLPWESVMYHDPCYLGRYNGIFDPPRALLHDKLGLVLSEMTRARENAFCCGAGGSQYWRSTELGQKINVERAREVVALGGKYVITACPYCMQMLEDGFGRLEVAVQVRDIAEVAEEVLQK